MKTIPEVFIQGVWLYPGAQARLYCNRFHKTHVGIVHRIEVGERGIDGPVQITLLQGSALTTRRLVWPRWRGAEALPEE